MAEGRRMYGEIDNQTDLKAVFSEIRNDTEHAKSRAGLTELYRRAIYLITLAEAPAWETKSGDELDEIRKAAEEEFGKTARKINHRAEMVGTDANYDEKWGD